MLLISSTLVYVVGLSGLRLFNDSQVPQKFTCTDVTCTFQLRTKQDFWIFYCCAVATVLCKHISSPNLGVLGLSSMKRTEVLSHTLNSSLLAAAMK